MGAAKKAIIVILSSAAGTAIGYPIFLFASLALLVVFGDDGRGLPHFLPQFLFYGVFGITTLAGFAAGLLIVKKST